MPSLALQIATTERHLASIVGGPASPMREALAFCLSGALDLARGAAALAPSRLTACQVLLTRALYERLVRTAWVALTDLNASLFLHEGRDELLRQGQKLLSRGIASTVHTHSGADHSAAVQSRIRSRGLKPPPPFEALANEAGIGAIHALMYGSLSALAHGHTLGPHRSSVDLHDALLSATAAYLEGITAIATNRLTAGRSTSPAELQAILKGPPNPGVQRTRSARR